MYLPQESFASSHKTSLLRAVTILNLCFQNTNEFVCILNFNLAPDSQRISIIKLLLSYMDGVIK